MAFSLANCAANAKSRCVTWNGTEETRVGGWKETLKTTAVVLGVLAALVAVVCALQIWGVGNFTTSIPSDVALYTFGGSVGLAGILGTTALVSAFRGPKPKASE